MIPDSETDNFEIYLECLSATVVANLSPTSKKGPRKRTKGRKNEIKPVVQDPTEKQENDAAELSDFVQVGPTTTNTSRSTPS